MNDSIKIGMLGASIIVEKAIVEPSAKVPGVQAYGLAARDVARAAEYARVHAIPRVFGSYDELVSSPEVDAVYISIANYVHKEWIIKAACNKKHVLVEKPICITTSDLDEIEKAVVENNVYLQEAAMVEHHQWQHTIKDIISTGTYGELKQLQTHFSFVLDKERSNYRYHPSMGGGVFFDLGTYWVQLVQLCTDLDIEHVVAHSAFDGENGIDREFEAKLVMKNGVSSEFYGSFNHPLNAEHTFVFEKARLRIRNFLKPAVGKLKMSIDIFDENDEKIDKIALPAESYYQNQLQHFADSIRAGSTGCKPGIRTRVELMERVYNHAKQAHTLRLT